MNLALPLKRQGPMLSTFTDINLEIKIDICEFSHKIFLCETIESRKLWQKVCS
jgi:hypothetical protein